MPERQNNKFNIAAEYPVYSFNVTAKSPADIDGNIRVSKVRSNLLKLN